MKKDLVVKDNALINASYSLNLVEQRLILLAIVVIRDHIHHMELEGLLGKPVEITVANYVKNFGVSQSTAYETIKEACKTLFLRQFSYQESRGNGFIANKTTRWVSDIAYIDKLATVEFTFAPAVLPLITELEKHLTSYELKQVAYLTSSYAVRLYELLIAWRSVGKTNKIKLNQFRQRMGILEHEYKRMELFKRRVLEPAIEQVNKHTDIKVSYEQHKEGRSIVAFSFSFKQKNPHQVPSGSLKDKNTIDMFTGLTEKQILLFARKLAYDDSFSSNYAEPGEDYDDVEKRLIQKLADPEFVLKHMNTLEAHGFKWKS